LDRSADRGGVDAARISVSRCSYENGCIWTAMMNAPVRFAAVATPPFVTGNTKPPNLICVAFAKGDAWPRQRLADCDGFAHLLFGRHSPDGLRPDAKSDAVFIF
jgi:hypothetical protein